MVMLPVLVVVGVATVLLYVYLTWHHQYWSKQRVPYIEASSLIFGSIKDLVLMKKSFRTAYYQFYWEYPESPLVGFFKLRQPAVLLRDPELIKTVLVKEFNSFHDTDFEVTKRSDPTNYDNPFFIKGTSRWKMVRTAVSLSLTGVRIKAAMPSILQSCQQLVTHLERRQGEDIEAKDLATKFTTDAVFSSGFGMEAKALLEPESKIWKQVVDVFSVNSWFNFSFVATLYIPIIAHIFKIGLVPREFGIFFSDIVKQVAEYREKAGAKRNDFLQSLIDLRNYSGPTDDTKLNVKTYDDIAMYSAILFFDGIETSSRPICYTLYEMAMNPDMQKRLRGEIDASIGSLDKMLDFDKIHSLAYLDMVVAESLRKYPPAVALTRRCTQSIKLPLSNGQSCDIRPGTLISVPVYALHYDPKYYPDPQRFDPERFSESVKSTRHRFTYLPFGEGPRICLGMKFAVTQIKAALVAIIKEFEILPTKRTQVPIQFNDDNLILLTSKDGIWLEFKKLN